MAFNHLMIVNNGVVTGLLMRITKQGIIWRDREFWRENREFYQPELNALPDKIFGIKNLWAISAIKQKTDVVPLSHRSFPIVAIRRRRARASREPANPNANQSGLRKRKLAMGDSTMIILLLVLSLIVFDETCLLALMFG
jgi:hypothetical protein